MTINMYAKLDNIGLAVVQEALSRNARWKLLRRVLIYTVKEKAVEQGLHANQLTKNQWAYWYTRFMKKIQILVSIENKNRCL